MTSPYLLPLTTLLAACTGIATADDWPCWGRTSERNSSCAETNLPTHVVPGKYIGASDEIDPTTTENVRWIARLGSQTYGNPTVADGRVYVGTNNDAPRNTSRIGDRSCVYCFDEKTGGFLWELSVPKLGTGQVSDWDHVGICSSPAVEGDRVYLVTNRCEVICLDVNGMEDGNQGFKDEGLYMAWPSEEPLEVSKTDADILWVLDMIAECEVAPHNVASSAVAIAGDRLWVTTSNGCDVDHTEVPAPDAPCLILVDKETGALIAEEQSGLSSQMLHANWTSPAYLKTDDLEMCIFGGPGGWVHAFAPEPEPRDGGPAVLKELWRCDANPADYRELDGKKVEYGARKGPSEVIATPMVANGLVYAVTGQDPERGDGAGNMVCIDPATGKLVWNDDGVNRSMSSLASTGGLVYAADYSGFVYCIDALTGERVWRHDTLGHIWGSPLVADGKVYVGNEDGYLTIIPAGRDYDKKKILEVDMASPIYSSPIAANGTLYIATFTHLFAIAEGGER